MVDHPRRTSSPDGQRHDRIQRADQRGLSLENAALDGDVAFRTDTRAVEISAGQRMLSATTGSVLTSLLVTPLDVVRVRLQSQAPPSALLSTGPALRTSTRFTNLPPKLGISACCREVFWINNNAQFCIATPSSLVLNTSTLSPSALTTRTAECAAEEAKRRSFTSTFDGLKKIARHEGLSTLWRGLSPTLVMAVPANVIYFTGYDWLRYDQRSPLVARVPDVYVPLVAGSLARAGAAMAIGPIEMFRTRLQATSSNGASETTGTRALYTETLRGLKELTQLQGYSSLWRGLTLTLWRDVPFSGLYWWGYEMVRGALKEARARNLGSNSPQDDTRARPGTRRIDENHTATLTDSFIAGAVSGALASVVTTPFDVGKTRQQIVQHSVDSKSMAPAASSTLSSQPLSPEQQSMPRLLWRIFRQEGIAGLFRGCTARVLKVAPACAIMISSYEVSKKMARGMNEPDR